MLYEKAVIEMLDGVYLIQLITRSPNGVIFKTINDPERKLKANFIKLFGKRNIPLYKQVAYVS